MAPRKKKTSGKKYYVAEIDSIAMVSKELFETDDFNEACRFIEGKPTAMVFARKD